MKTILDVVAELRSADPALTYLERDEDVAVGKFLEFTWAHWNGTPKLVPCEALNLPGRPGDRSFLYRGQSTVYPTCVATLLRGDAPNDAQFKAKLALERFRIAELELVLRDHPFTRVAREHGFVVDYHGLAQHYGLQTSLLDLTSNVEVASFFAVAKWDSHAGTWIPADDRDGTGVMYRLDWSAFGPGYSRAFEPVGFGPGLRPARQHGWTIRLRPGADFARMPHVEAFQFDHTREASEEIFDRFAQGSSLYPPDCLASLVERLRDLPFLTMHGVRHAARSDQLTADQVDDAADRAAHFIHAVLGLDVVDEYELALLEEDVRIASVQATALDDAIRRMRKGVMLVRTRRADGKEGSVTSQEAAPSPPST